MHSPQFSGLRWTRICVASTATALFATTASVGAFASHTHILRHGESLDTLARTYHVSVQDLVDANHIDDQNRIPDGRRLTIPAPPKSLVAPTTMHRSARIAKNQVSVRLGPGLDYRRMVYGFEGEKVVVTATEGEWSQVARKNGHTGWILTSLLELAKPSAIDTVASRSHKKSGGDSSPGHKTPHAVAMTGEDDRKRIARTTRLRASDTSNVRKHHDDEQHPKAVAHATHDTHKGSKVAKASHATGKPRKSGKLGTKHKAELALSSHRRKNSLTKTAKNKSHKQLASRRHSNSDYRPIARSSKRHKGSNSSGGNDLVRTAYAYRGTPYVWGGERPGGFDCSGLTKHLYAKKGIDLPHSARAQFEMGNRVDRHGLKPGDLVFFHTVTPGISHVGIYVGNGNFVHASNPRKGVRMDSLDSAYYSKAYRGARRMK